MTPIFDHPDIFRPYTDPVSGVKSYLLEIALAPIQQSFYFCTPSMSADGRWLWFHTAFPPAPKKTLGVVDLQSGEARHFPQAQFPTAEPCVLPQGDAVLFGAGATIFRLEASGEVGRVAELPGEYLAGRHLWRMATHLTLSSDGTRVLLDGHVGGQWFVATAEIATGKVEIHREFTAHHNHAQFSPVHPSEFLIAQDQYRDPCSGRFTHHIQRTFLADLDGARYEHLTVGHPCRPFHGACHEWWIADGRVGYIDYDRGAFEVDPATGRREHVWQEPLCHAHCDSSGLLWCADESPYKWDTKPCQVLFFNRTTGRKVAIFSNLPPPPGDYWATRSAYHIDPHPQFSPCGRWVVSTATLDGRVTPALTSVEDLFAATRDATINADTAPPEPAGS